MKKLIIGAVTLAAVLASCSSSTETSVAEIVPVFDETAYLTVGDSIAMHAQKTLLANVAEAMQSSGAHGAVDFCNERAIPLTDSIAGIHAVSIQRMSDKNRNPGNVFASKGDEKAWEDLKAMMQDESIQEKHLVMEENGNVYYYKPIALGMPTCLACHGSKESDIAAKTLEVINTKYPDDKATGYQMGQLRGMWKIQLEKNIN